ncbi:MAG: DNA-3-methyladenine glycosylase [Clostridia bacterium]|nr:DNA-3-methyladenine glycosylase [Clostridia bacterium]
MAKLEREFYLGNTVDIAKKLIGCTLVSVTADGVTSGRIVETEAYLGTEDTAAHASKGDPKGRTRVLFGEGGYAYVYLIYGMYNCLNFATGPAGKPECVLIRALEPVEGMDIMAARRNTDKPAALCSGPGKLCMALGITRADYGADLCGDSLYVLEREGEEPQIAATPRINIDYAPEHRDKPWRFVDKNSKYLSVKLK